MAKQDSNEKYVKYAIIAFIAIALVVTLVSLMPERAYVPSGQQGQVQQPGQIQQPATGEIDLQGVNALGDPDAPVVVVEYSSFTCPFCARHNLETFDRIVQEYVETGKVYYVYKHFIRNEVDSVAANAAECAGEQDRFFEYKSQIYQNQNSISNPGFFEGIASNLGLDMDSWRNCFDSGRYTQKANADRAEGMANGVTGTPGFVINGQLVSGAQPFQAFQQVIESQL